MRKLLAQVDDILRGKVTRPEVLRERGMELAIGRLAIVLIVLAAFYGACMGCFALFRAPQPLEAGSWAMQILASAAKTPALFFLTILVTFPSLYVFNALVGSRLQVTDVLRLLVAALAVNLAVLAAFGPIVAFFSVSTESYAFMVLLNVVVFAVAGFMGLQFLVQTLHRVTSVLYPPPRDATSALPPADEPGESAGGESSTADRGLVMPTAEDPAPPDSKSLGALDRTEDHALGRHVQLVFRCWMIVFGLVGAQMGWVLRPFIGAPAREFAWFRARESNFFEAVFGALQELLSR